MTGDRHREIAYHQLESLDADQALYARARQPDVETVRAPGVERSPRTSGRAMKRGGWVPNPYLTDRERDERWPIG